MPKPERDSSKEDPFSLSYGEEEAVSLPKAIYIAPLVLGLVLLTTVLVGLYIWRNLEREPVYTSSEEPEDFPLVEHQTVKIAANKPAEEKENNLEMSNLASSGVGLVELIKAVEPAVGMVLARAPGGVTSGSGFVIRGDGLFVTNYHVVESAAEILVKLPNRDPVRAYELRRDVVRDLALLRFEAGDNYPVLKLDGSDLRQKGEEVLVLGYPLGTRLGLDISVSTGIISSVREYEDAKILQTTAAINHGNSGGPLIRKADGRVIGVVTARVKGSESIGFAIDIRELKHILEGR
ncbi:MAG: trypsin-like peptidase domain-containing protein [Acidobacteriota bacterium]|nr:serine protease [Blastocatellia bacterium]MDW8411546.1 trypsin-like peptidase domain-containing protein [Acidobacteriota bacterium]